MYQHRFFTFKDEARTKTVRLVVRALGCLQRGKAAAWVAVASPEDSFVVKNDCARPDRDEETGTLNSHVF